MLRQRLSSGCQTRIAVGIATKSIIADGGEYNRLVGCTIGNQRTAHLYQVGVGKVVVLDDYART